MEKGDNMDYKVEKEKKAKKSGINPYVLIFSVIVLAAILSFIITPGKLENGIYTALPKNKINFNNLFNIFRAVPYGLRDSASISLVVLVVGGALEIYNRTGAIDAGISALVNKFGTNTQAILLCALLILFSAIGGFLGWIETLIPFVPLVIAVILALGYDGITAVAVPIVGLMGGFMAGPTNILTVGVCNEILQEIGALPKGGDLFVGLSYRIIIWIAVTAVSIIYILSYGNKVRKDPTKSLVADVDVTDIKINKNTDQSKDVKMTITRVLVLLTILCAMVLCVIGLKFGINGVIWSVDDVSAVFFLSGIIAGIIGRMDAGVIADSFIEGAKNALGGAFIIGVARGVYWVLDTANINATVIHSATELLKGTSPLIASIGIVIIVSFINGLIPSGSGKGVLLTPILGPIGLNLGLSPATTVLAYQFGDGITNMFWFTYGTLLIFLSYGKVPINKWYKFFTPLMLIFFMMAFIFLAIAINIGY